MSSWLVTGGAGFIGSHLVDALLARGDRVRVLDDLSSGHRGNLPPAAELVVGSVTDAALVRRSIDGVDGVFHLAAIASVVRCTEDWPGAHAVNQTGTVTVLDGARRAGGVPVVYASSAAVYGDAPGDPVRETDPTAPCSAYGCDKLGGELHAQVARRTFGVPTLGLRFFNVYGPRQDGSSPYSGVISVFRSRLAAGQPLVLNGDGEQLRDFVHVADVVAALLAGMRRLPDLPPVLNVCSGSATSIRELALMLGEALGVTPLLRTGPDRSGDIRRSRGDPGLMIASLGVQCGTGIRDGLRGLALAEPILAEPILAEPILTAPILADPIRRSVDAGPELAPGPGLDIGPDLRRDISKERRTA